MSNVQELREELEKAINESFDMLKKIADSSNKAEGSDSPLVAAVIQSAFVVVSTLRIVDAGIVGLHDDLHQMREDISELKAVAEKFTFQ